jgi:hypothetical protein
MSSVIIGSPCLLKGWTSKGGWGGSAVKHAWEGRMCRCLGGKHERNYNLEDWRIVLEWTLRMVWIWSVYLSRGTSSELLWARWWTSGSIKGDGYLTIWATVSLSGGILFRADDLSDSKEIILLLSCSPAFPCRIHNSLLLFLKIRVMWVD